MKTIKKLSKYLLVLVITWILNGFMCWISSSDMGFFESLFWFETLITTFVLSVIPLTVLYLLEDGEYGYKYKYEDLLNYLKDKDKDEKN